ncbi:MAG: ribbon-helix-helix protein, CopG family [Rickettsiaceae bacterium]|nr:ribbon-helix-helix protein, CopG family [Rickettsiaceae bacterium]
MSVISVRIDSEVDSILTKLSLDRGVTKSDMVRILIVKGLEKENLNIDGYDEFVAIANSNKELLVKNFKATAQVLALTLRIMNNIDSSEIEVAKSNAKQFLEKNGVE